MKTLKPKTVNIKIDPLDQLCSKIVRLRSKGICEIGGEYKGYDRLMACHCFGRGNKKVRYDLDKRLGKLGYMDLKRRAYWPSMAKVDKKLVKMFLETELKKYSGENL